MKLRIRIDGVLLDGLSLSAIERTRFEAMLGPLLGSHLTQRLSTERGERLVRSELARARLELSLPPNAGGAELASALAPGLVSTLWRRP
jgi:hypothetical protein